MKTVEKRVDLFLAHGPRVKSRVVEKLQRQEIHGQHIWLGFCISAPHGTGSRGMTGSRARLLDVKTYKGLFPPAKFHELNIPNVPKHHPQLRTSCSNTGVSGGHYNPKGSTWLKSVRFYPKGSNSHFEPDV